MSHLERRPVEAEDILRLRSVSDPRLSPDGERIVFVVRRTDAEKNRYFSDLWVAPFEEGEPRQFTTGDHGDASPRWSPDGRTIAFISDRGESAQVWLLPADGGEARQLTRLEEGSVNRLQWSPDGTRLAFAYRAKPPEDRKAARELREKEHRSNPPRVVRRLIYRMEGEGFIGEERWHVWVADAQSGEARPVTQGDFDHGAFAWSPDGSELVVVSNHSAEPDITRGHDDFWRVPAEGGEAQRVECTPGPKETVAWSPDGQWLAYYGTTDPEDEWGIKNEALLVAPAAGGEARDLTQLLDRPVGNAILADFRSGGFLGPIWSGDSRGLFCLINDWGGCHLYHAPIEAGEPNRIAGGARDIASLSFDASRRRVVSAIGDARQPGEVYVAEADGGFVYRRRSDVNEALLGEVALAEPEEFTLEGPGGPLHGWTLRPPDFDAGRRYPAILYIHGGPHTQYGHAFMHEFQYLAAAGYVIVYSNPRGSKGYGYEHTAAIRGCWGGPDYADLMAVADHAAALPYVDETRIGVTGGSYGGYMTNWIVGHTARFRAAVTQRSVVNLHSMAGTCDFNFTESRYFGGDAYANPEGLIRQSPLFCAGAVETPLLIIHSEGDLRCPIEQAEQLFAALRRQGKEVEFVRYPREANHGLSRGGPPDLRLDRLRRIREWMDRYLAG